MSFTVFDGLLYLGKPAIPGTRTLAMLQGNALPPAGSTGAFYYDWEPPITAATAPQVSQQMLSQLAAARAVAPRATLGAYNLAPLANYWAFVDPKDSGQSVAGVQAINDELRPIAQSSDWLFPCLYTWYTNDPAWWIAALGNIAEARRISDRPLAPFVMPIDQTEAHAPVDQTLWAQQLALIRQSCDGIVLWGGWQQQWDASAPWWLTAQQVLGTMTPSSELRRV